jgi:hypothetical protein
MHASVTLTSSERKLSTMAVLKHGSGGVRACFLDPRRFNGPSLPFRGVAKERIKRQTWRPLMLLFSLDMFRGTRRSSTA